MADEEKKDEVTSEETEEKSEETKEEESSEKPSGEEEKEEKKDKIKEEEEPPVRFKREEQGKEEKRLGFELRKARDKIKELEGGGYKEEETYTSEEDRPLTRREFEEKMEEKEKKDSSENLLRSFIDEYPDYKKYEGRIRKYMNDPNYQNIPIGFIADGIAGRDLEAEGARKQKEADEEAEETKTGGSSKRGIPKKKGVWDMTKEEFQAHQDEVRNKGRE